MAKQEQEISESEEEQSKYRRTDNNDLYRSSSQYRLWSFTRTELEERKIQINEKGKKVAQRKALAVFSAADKSPVDIDLVSVEEESKIISHYARRAHDIAHVFKMPSQARATAISYFRKFFLVHSVMEYHPKFILFTCIFLAAKTENFFIKLSSFLKVIPKTTPEDILDLEYVIIQSLSFTLFVHHPFRPLYGFYLDIQNYLDLDNNKFYKVYEKAKTVINDSLITDAPFLFTPPQIALAAFYTVDNKIIDKYLRRKYLPKVDETVDKMETIEEDIPEESTQGATDTTDTNKDNSKEGEQLEEAASKEVAEDKGVTLFNELMESVKECSDAFKTIYNPTREESTEIDKKVFFCINPDRLLKKRESSQ